MPNGSTAVAATGDRPDAKRDSYYWRLVATGLSFLVFGIGQLVLGLLIFPIVRLLPGDTTTDNARARALLRRTFRLFIEFMRCTGVLTYDFGGVARLGKPGQLILANHPSLIDVVFLLGFTPSAGCVVKVELWSNLFTRFAVASAGYVSNSPTDLMIEGAAAALAGGQTLVMFPEGTRTRPGEPLHFHRGAASVALSAATSVTPVYIDVNPTTLTKAEPWYRIPARRPHFCLRVGADIDMESFRRMASPPAGSRAFNSLLLDVFFRELKLAPKDERGPPTEI
jgi:1-acyl-sn-glycerol-3-phosphate acyltransferase